MAAAGQSGPFRLLAKTPGHHIRTARTPPPQATPIRLAQSTRPSRKRQNFPAPARRRTPGSPEAGTRNKTIMPMDKFITALEAHMKGIFRDFTGFLGMDFFIVFKQ
jgi:hypothetical protein